MKRLDSVDVMRALAIIFMVVCHFQIFLSPLEPDHKWLYFFSNHIVGDLAAPFFLFLSGLSQVLSIQKRAGMVQPVHEPLWRDRTLKRGAAVFLVGILFSISIHGPGAAFEWDVLTLIGASMVALRVVRGAGPKLLVFFAVGVVVLSPVLRSYGGYIEPWGGVLNPVAGITDLFPAIMFDPAAEYSAGRSFFEVLNGFFIGGYFPLFPWLAFPLAGFAVGKAMAVGTAGALLRMLLAAKGVLFLAVGLVLAAFGAARGGGDLIGGFVTALGFYPATVSMWCVQMGLTLLVFVFLTTVCDGREATGGVWILFFRLFSRYSLTVYVLHHMVIFYPLYVAGALHGDLKMYHAGAIGVWAAFLLSLLFLALMVPVLGLWDKRGGKYSLEWCLARLV